MDEYEPKESRTKFWAYLDDLYNSKTTTLKDTCNPVQDQALSLKHIVARRNLIDEPV